MNHGFIKCISGSNASFLEIRDHVGGLPPTAVSEVNSVAGVEAVMGREAGRDVGEADLSHNVSQSDLRGGNSPALIGC